MTHCRDISIIKVKTAISGLFCLTVTKNLHTHTHTHTHTRCMGLLQKVPQQQTNQNAYYRRGTKNIYLLNDSIPRMKRRNLVITILRLWDHPVVLEKVCEAKVEFSQPMWGGVRFHFVYTSRRWLSAVTTCQRTVDSRISLVLFRRRQLVRCLFQHLHSFLVRCIKVTFNF